MTLFTWVWDGEKKTLDLQHLSPPALTKYAPASALDGESSTSILLWTLLWWWGWRGLHAQMYRAQGWLNTSVIQIVWCPKCLHTRPVVRLFAAQNMLQVPSDAERLHLLDPRKITPPGPASPVSNARAWKEFSKHHLESLVPRPGPAYWSLDSNHWAHQPWVSRWQWGNLRSFLGGLVLLTSQGPGFSRCGEAVIPSTPMGSGLWNINPMNWAEWGAIPHPYFPKERLPSKL